MSIIPFLNNLNLLINKVFVYFRYLIMKDKLALVIMFIADLLVFFCPSWFVCFSSQQTCCLHFSGWIFEACFKAKHLYNQGRSICKFVCNGYKYLSLIQAYWKCHVDFKLHLGTFQKARQLYTHYQKVSMSIET